MKVVMPLRKRSSPSPSKRSNLNFNDDDEISSSSEEESDTNEIQSNDDDDEEENLQVKKVRLAREYLSKVDAALSSSDDSEEEDSEDDENNIRGNALSRKLQKKRQIREGTYRRKLAGPIEKYLSDIQTEVEKKEGYVNVVEKSSHCDTKQLSQFWMESTSETLRYLKPYQTHQLTPTCLALCDSNSKAVSGSKDHSVVLWDLTTEQRIGFLANRFSPKTASGTSHQRKSHRTQGHVLSLAASGHTVVAGSRDGRVRLYDIRQDEPLVHTFQHAKDGISALRFLNDEQFLAASLDRCIRVYHPHERLLAETLFGHQAPIHDLATTPHSSYPVSVGADRTSRVWKLDTDSHLILRCPTAAADCVTMLDATTFCTGHADGSLQLWQHRRKQALAKLEHSAEAGIVRVTSRQDVVVAGSCDGYLRFYSYDEDSKRPTLHPMAKVPVHGFINDIVFPSDTTVLAAVGQEHKWGRWERSSGAKNRIVLLSLAASASENSTMDEGK